MSVYVIECAGLLKIGYSETPERRTERLFQSASRYSAPRAAYEARGTQRLVHVIDRAGKDDERFIHFTLDDYSIGCEWFVNEPAVMDFVRSFTPGEAVTPRLERPGIPAWKELPREELGGCNYDLMRSVLTKRAARAS